MDEPDQTTGGPRKPGRAKKEDFTLVLLVKALVGQRIEVELRNDTAYKGRLESVASDMTCTLSEVTCSRPGSSASSLDTLGNTFCSCFDSFTIYKTCPCFRVVILLNVCSVIQGKHIRYVPIPDAIDIRKTLDRHDKRKEMARGRRKTKT